MWLPGGRTGLLVALVAWSSACVGGQPQAHTSASPSPAASAPSPDALRCARLARRGFAVCPPTPDRLPLPPTTIRNATNGAVPDRTAQQWGRAFQRTEAYYRWAMSANLRDVLTSGAFADATASYVLFGQDLKSLDEAKGQGGVLVDHEGSIPETSIVGIPAQLQQSITQQGLTPRDYGIAALFAGTTTRSIQFPDGHELLLGRISNQVRLLIWGQYKVDSELGPIWYEYGLYGCQYPEVASVCQS